MKTILKKDKASAIIKIITDLRTEHRKMRVDHSMNKLSKTSELRRVRKEIAKNLTYLHQKGAFEASKSKKKK